MTAFEATLTHLGLNPTEFDAALLAADDARIKVLNAEFRDKDTPTNVLSWPTEDLAAEIDGETPDVPSDEELGDMALAFETCSAEAKDQNKSLENHVTHLIIHGTLHLLGYDHIRDNDATLMEQIERDVLDKLGIDDPYR